MSGATFGRGFEGSYGGDARRIGRSTRLECKICWYVYDPTEGEDWPELRAGDKEEIAFPTGEYQFVHNNRPGVGGYKMCSLFSPMFEFTSQL